jgi:hypothetical protein
MTLSALGCAAQGGSHGGFGSTATSTPALAAGVPCGGFEWPTNMGAGGVPNATSAGGAGGSAVALIANSSMSSYIDISGTIRVNGAVSVAGSKCSCGGCAVAALCTPLLNHDTWSLWLLRSMRGDRWRRWWRSWRSRRNRWSRRYGCRRYPVFGWQRRCGDAAITAPVCVACAWCRRRHFQCVCANTASWAHRNAFQWPGVLAAFAGSACSISAGSGSGGRIAIHAGQLLFNGTASACGVAGSTPSAAGTVFFSYGVNRTTRYRRLVVDNCNASATGDMVTSSLATVLADRVGQYLFSEIVTTRRGALFVLAPPTTVTDKVAWIVGALSGDGTGKIRVDSRVELVWTGVQQPLLTAGTSSGYVQFVSQTQRRVVLETSVFVSSVALTHGDLLVLGGNLSLPANVTVCGGTLRNQGRVTGGNVIQYCNSAQVNVTGLASVYGCKNATALNFNPTASVDDSSCIFNAVVPGCTYRLAANFNPVRVLHVLCVHRHQFTLRVVVVLASCCAFVWSAGDR